MRSDITEYTRLFIEDIPVYIRGDVPTWFVPNEAGDKLLQTLASGERVPHADRFLGRLPDPLNPAYTGRKELLSRDQLSELWFHVTNRCNLACRHCLFASCPSDGASLPAPRILDIAREATALGCRVFALTGGEPFIHPEFTDIVDGLLAHDGAHVVVLTNATLLREHAEHLRRWDRERLHLQVSVDGLGDNHDWIRGKGAFDHLRKELKWLKGEGFPFTVSMCVEKRNLHDMQGLVGFAADAGAANLHFMWYFVRGRGQAEEFAAPNDIFKELVACHHKAAKAGIGIDNIDAMRTQVFAPSGTIHDGTNGAWESAAIGPDGRLYPTAALVGEEQLAVSIDNGLAEAWRDNEVLEAIRSATAAETNRTLRFITGGGDLDHSYIHAGTFIGDDPYLPLYEQLALWLISNAAQSVALRQPTDTPALLLRMGDILESCGAHGAVALVHSNCLLAMASEDSRTAVKNFYSEAVGDTKKDILNPVCYPQELLEHIPEAFRLRGYGCGSPVMDAGIEPGETVMDLGCGSGVECFIAARFAGVSGRVIGVDMLDPMLAFANRAADGVAENLGYANFDFRKGYLENLPVEDHTVDVALSNCVMNLSTNKRKAFDEIYRVLKPGGRLVISDVVCETEPDPAIRNDDVLRGECIAGALRQRDLVGILEETGFEAIRILKRFPYRLVQGHPFFSMTYEAAKPASFSSPASSHVRVLYRGPAAELHTESGATLLPGVPAELPRDEAERYGNQLFLLDSTGAVTNVAMQASCSCMMPPEATMQTDDAPDTGEAGPKPMPDAGEKHRSGCMVCGAALEYYPEERYATCSYCGREMYANALCREGHFVCDDCHAHDALGFIERICLHTEETDMIRLFHQVRSHHAIPIHGPEYHAIIPGVILATYRNLGGPVTAAMIQTGIRRGSQIAGGACGFMGACGAALGVGVAFGLIQESHPLKPAERQALQTATASILGKIGSLEAARCCLRDGQIALQEAARLSIEFLPIALKAEAEAECNQRAKNAECAGSVCPYFTVRVK
jgi:MoaA/NifB/PqqE/SkfB family radical SAM enzyme/SAM-dependent methyltransferase